MKKVFLSIVAILAFGFTNAQTVKFGVKGGLNVTTITGGELSASSKVGFHVGGLAEIKFGEKFAVQPELLYSTKGAKSNYDFGFGGGDLENNLSYIDLPVMVKYFVIEGLSIEAGPQVSFLIDANQKFDGESEDIKEFMNTVDFGFNIGAGYALPNGLMFQARYNLGLMDISKEEDGAFTNYDEKNNGFQISVGYMF